MATETGRVIVKFKDAKDLNKAELDSRCEAVRAVLPKAKFVRLSERSGRAVFSVDLVADLDQRIEEISHRGDIEYAERDTIDSV